MTKREQDDSHHDSLRCAVDDLVRRLPHHALRTVIDEIDHTTSPTDGRARALRGALVEHFNRLRPMKARRLFTSLFEPLLVDDAILYRAHHWVPGLVQRADIGGLWCALEHFAFPKLAAQVQHGLDVLSRDALLDTVLAGPDALMMRTAMAREASAFLGALPENRKLADSFLIYANREAFKAACHRSPHLQAKAPMTLDVLDFLRDLLRESETLIPMIVRMLDEVPDEIATGEDKEAEVDRVAALLVGHARELRSLFPDKPPLDPILWLSPLSALNIKRRHDVVQRFLREYAGPSSFDQHPMHQAVFAHFSGCIGTLADISDAAAGQAQADVDESLAMPRPVRDLFDDALRRLDIGLRTMSSSGLMSNRTIGPKVRPMLIDVTGVLTERLIPLCLSRTLEAFNARNYPEPDQDDIVWTLQRIWEWSATLGKVGYANTNTNLLRAKLREEGQKAFLAAIRPEPEDIPEKRLDHIVRINQLLSAIGENIGPWISLMSQGLQNMIRQELEFPTKTSPEVDDVIDRYIATVRSELGRSRHWQSVELVSLLKLYEERRGCPA